MRFSRRSVLAAGWAVGAASAVSACTTVERPTPERLALPAQEPLNRAPGQNVVETTLRPRKVTLDLGGPIVNTWGYDDSLPGPTIRATAGDLLRIELDNQLPSSTSVHWHGVALRAAADGVPNLSQHAVRPGDRYVYEFVAPDPGTYFYHPHVGVQLDRGLYAPLIIDDPREPGDYDVEWVVILDDWIDGTGTTPDAVLAQLLRTAAESGGRNNNSGEMGDMGAMDMSSDMPMDHSTMRADGSPYGDAGDVTYPHYLINGRVPAAPSKLNAKPKQRVRVRCINAAADTIFAVALTEHRMTLTHADGFPIKPREVGAFYVGMGERYDFTVTLDGGVFALVADAVGKPGRGRALIRTGAGEAPPANLVPVALAGPITLGSDLEPDESVRLSRRDPTQSVALTLAGQMTPYAWTINGAAYPDNDPTAIDTGGRIQIQMENRSMMAHPVHLHGHTFALPNGLRKDTVLLAPMQNLDVEFQADNPGNWAVHCHNAYHAEAGMMAALTYQT